jgi:hypothetical protein
MHSGHSGGTIDLSESYEDVARPELREATSLRVLHPGLLVGERTVIVAAYRQRQTPPGRSPA